MSNENMEEKLEDVEVGQYGFRVNLHEKPSDVIIRIGWLEKLGLNYAISGKKMIIGSFSLAGFILVLGLYAFTNMTRLKYIFIPTVAFSVGFLIILAQFIFINPSSGSLFKSSKKMLNLLISNQKIKNGKKVNLNDLGIYVKPKGRLEYANGDFGRMFLVDGTTSSTAYPDEVKAQEDIAKRYHTGRDRTTTETKITSSQRQNTEKQLANIDKQIRKNRKNEGIFELASQQRNFINHSINGVKTTTVQYMIVRNKSENDLLEHIDRLNRMTNQGLYYNLKQLSSKEAEKVLSDIVNLK